MKTKELSDIHGIVYSAYNRLKLRKRDNKSIRPKENIHLSSDILIYIYYLNQNYFKIETSNNIVTVSLGTQPYDVIIQITNKVRRTVTNISLTERYATIDCEVYYLNPSEEEQVVHTLKGDNTLNKFQYVSLKKVVGFCHDIRDMLEDTPEKQTHGHN